MNLIYLLASLAGIGLLAGLNWLLLTPVPPRLELQTAQDVLGFDDPQVRVTAFVAAGKAGLALAQDGALFAVAAAGDKLVGRKLTKGFVRAVSSQKTQLRLRLNDPGFSDLQLNFADPETANLWAARLQPLLPQNP